MTNDALKPCPFCGGDADIDEFEGKLLETVFAASCNNDDCPIGHKDHGSWPTKTDALNSWNTRAALAPVDVERLKDWISEATSIFEHIIHDLRDNQDLSHKDFRIKVSEMAHDYLSHNHIRHLAAQGYIGGGWQPIETASIEGCLWVMLGHPDYHVSEVGYYNKRYNVWVDGSDRTLFMPHGPTHWMPLPAAPKKEGV